MMNDESVRKTIINSDKYFQFQAFFFFLRIFNDGQFCMYMLEMIMHISTSIQKFSFNSRLGLCVCLCNKKPLNFFSLYCHHCLFCHHSYCILNRNHMHKNKLRVSSQYIGERSVRENIDWTVSKKEREANDKNESNKEEEKKRFNSMRFKEISTNCFHRSIELRHTSWEREAACWSDVCLFSGFIFGNAQTCDNVSTQSLFKFVKTWLCTMSRASVSRILYWWILNGIHDRIIKNNWWQ